MRIRRQFPVLLLVSLSIALLSCNQENPPVAAAPVSKQKYNLPWVRKDGPKGVIVFVHGILGDDRGTWTNGSHYWPQMLTADSAFDGQAIYVYRYPTPVLKQTLSVEELAENMRVVLYDDGVLAFPQITFVAHSMGGLVTRQFVVRYREMVASKIRLLFFFGTPTAGSPYAVLADLVSKNPQIKNMYPMRNPDSYLRTLESDWLAANLGLRSYCGYETERLWRQELIVDRPSATHLCTQRVDPIPGDHLSIVKPDSNTHTAYRALRVAFDETRGNERPGGAQVTVSKIGPIRYKRGAGIDDGQQQTVKISRYSLEVTLQIRNATNESISVETGKLALQNGSGDVASGTVSIPPGQRALASGEVREVTAFGQFTNVNRDHFPSVLRGGRQSPAPLSLTGGTLSYTVTPLSGKAEERSIALPRSEIAFSE